MRKLFPLFITLILGINLYAQEEIIIMDEQIVPTTEMLTLNDSETMPVDLSNLVAVSMGENEIAYVQQNLANSPNRITAGILAILLGDLGIQHFYTGQTVRGIIDILFCWTGIPAIVGLVEGIIWLTEDDASFQARVAKWKH